MRSLKGLLMLAVLALLFTANVRAACPDGPDCLWIDVDVCGTCVVGDAECGKNSHCPSATCSGVCSTDGVTVCNGDADCTNGQCVGYCEDGVTTCFGDHTCPACVGSTAGAGSQSDPFCSVNEAFQNAAIGDTLYVSPGTYSQCVDISPLGVNSGAEDRPVQLLAQAFAESQQNPDTIADTVFDGTDLCLAAPPGSPDPSIPVVTIEGSASSMTGFTVTGGTASGVYISGGTVTVSHNHITDNQSVEGAGIAVRTEACNYGSVAEVLISDNEITNNAAEAEPQGFLGEGLGHGGGVHVFALEEFNAGCNSVVTTRIENNVITGNTVRNLNSNASAVRYRALGGGVWVSTAMEPGGTALISIKDNEISGNGPTTDTPASAGGGIFATTRSDGFGTETIVIEGNTIGPNNKAHEGGGIAAWAISSPTADHHIDILKNEIRDNLGYSTSSAGAGAGASLRVEGIDMTAGDAVSIDFDQNRVTGNNSDATDGGGLRASILAERSVDEPLGINASPAERLELNIRDNTIDGNRSAVGGAGALLLLLVDADPVFGNTGICGTAQLPAAATMNFLRNLVTNNRGENVTGYTEVGAGILTIPTTFGEARATINIEDSTLAGNTITEDFGGAGGLDTLTYVDPDCRDHIDVVVDVGLERSIVYGNTGYGLGSTLLSTELPDQNIPAGALVTPAISNYIFANPAGTARSGYHTPPSNSLVADNFLSDPDLTGSYAPNACSPVFDVKRCAGATTTCQDDFNCPAGPPQTPCVTGVGFHGNPDIAPDFIIDGLDILDLAVAFNSTDAPDPRYSAAADLAHNGIVDGEDLSYMGSLFGQVCVP